MYGNIVIPVSFEEGRNIEHATEVAQKLASENARITFMHITEAFPRYMADHIPPDAWVQMKEDAQKRLDQLAEGVDNAETAVVDGLAGKTITDWARDKGVDLIVIASHRPKMSDIFLGSTAAWVVRHADCPVHVVR